MNFSYLISLVVIGLFALPGSTEPVSPVTSTDSGTIIYHKVYPGIPGVLEETVLFSGAESIRTLKRKKQVLNLPSGYRITHPAKDEKMYIDQSEQRIVEQQYSKKKKDYVLWSYPSPAYEWTLHEEYRTIGKYKCQKATVMHHAQGWGVATAWFTTEIPLSVGPERTYGLPGLIIELGFENSWDAKYILQEIRFEPVGDLEPREGIWISDENEDNKSQGKGRKKELQDVLNNG